MKKLLSLMLVSSTAYVSAMEQAAVVAKPDEVSAAAPVVQESEFIKLARTLSLSSLLDKQGERSKFYAAKVQEYAAKKASLEADKAEALRRNAEAKEKAIADRQAELAKRWAIQRAFFASTIDFDQKYPTKPIEDEYAKKQEELQKEYKGFEEEEEALATIVTAKLAGAEEAEREKAQKGFFARFFGN